MDFLKPSAPLRAPRGAYVFSTSEHYRARSVALPGKPAATVATRSANRRSDKRVFRLGADMPSIPGAHSFDARRRCGGLGGKGHWRRLLKSLSH